MVRNWGILSRTAFIGFLGGVSGGIASTFSPIGVIQGIFQGAVLGSCSTALTLLCRRNAPTIINLVTDNQSIQDLLKSASYYASPILSYTTSAKITAYVGTYFDVPVSHSMNHSLKTLLTGYFIASYYQYC